MPFSCSLSHFRSRCVANVNAVSSAGVNKVRALRPESPKELVGPPDYLSRGPDWPLENQISILHVIQNSLYKTMKHYLLTNL